MKRYSDSKMLRGQYSAILITLSVTTTMIWGGKRWVFACTCFNVVFCLGDINKTTLVCTFFHVLNILRMRTCTKDLS